MRAGVWTSGLMVLGGLGLSLLVGCAGGTTSSSKTGTQGQAAVSPPSGDLPEVLATIGNEQVTMTDIRARVGENLDRLETRYGRDRHKAIETALEEIMRDRVLMAEAKKQGKSVDELVLAEAGGSLEPSEVEISAWYQDNQARTGGRSLDQIRTQIADYLRNERRKEASQKLEQRLNQERKVTVYLEPYRLEFDNSSSPALGPENAPVTLVEFSDFECPFCGRFFPTLKQVERNYGNRVRIVYRQFPISSIHRTAQKAAEASLCAHEQGKFWEVHDLLFQEQQKLGVSDLKEKAGRLGLDRKKFDTCLDSGRYVEQVERDLKEGNRVGVTGTPAIFLNGVSVEGGAVPYDVIAKAIEKELARAKR